MDAKVESRVLNGNIGYIRIPFMLVEPELFQDLVDIMVKLADTVGLIIDIRDNGGGSRAPLKVLFPFLMKPAGPPRVVNVAAYRIGTRERKDAFQARHLYPVSSLHRSDAERKVVAAFAKTFQPEWPLSKEKFSEWHCFVISPSKDSRYYYDKPVVILPNRQNFGASDIFLGAFKGWRNVTLMELPSGGGSGGRIKYRQKNSGIAIYLSLMASFQPNGQLYDGNGIQPDVRIARKPTATSSARPTTR
ncbi:hypothetical protein AMJ85_10430 [candidate division BRC1 bacterium SM23_51]|nr:MAG: hypothetical protein AMJ85_10430 [candidate division BRC1 bacterium SM23_51]